MGDLMVYMLCKEGRISPESIGIDMKRPEMAYRYLRTILYVKKKEQQQIQNLSGPTTSEEGFSYQISPEEYQKEMKTI